VTEAWQVEVRSSNISRPTSPAYKTVWPATRRSAVR